LPPKIAAIESVLSFERAPLSWLASTSMW
jgi:hypothetical protein